MLLLASLLLLAPPVDLIDPWQRRGEAPSDTAATTRGDLVDPWAAPPREPPPARTSDLVDPWAVPPREAPGPAPTSDLIDPWSGAPRTTPGEGHASRRELKDPYADVRRGRARSRGGDLRNPFSPRP